MAPAGRPRAFDLDAAEETAMQLFWDRGYEGVSLADLKDSMGISSASFYAAFGSKEGLFERVVRRYAAVTNHIMRIISDESLPAREAVALYLHESVDAQTRTDNPKGCLIALNGTLGGAGVPEPARDAIRFRRDADRRQIHACVARAAARGDLRPDVDLEGWTAALHGFTLGVAVQARDGVSADELHRAADVLLVAWDATTTPTVAGAAGPKDPAAS
jgi:AcrR family transcriptional regulator